MSAFKALKLEHPITWGSEQISELSFRRPKGGDLMDFPDKPGMGDLTRLASRLSGKELPIIKELDINDFMKVMEIVGDFFQNSQAIGSNG
jgi:hypothetical protein